MGHPLGTAGPQGRADPIVDLLILDRSNGLHCGTAAEAEQRVYLVNLANHLSLGPPDDQGRPIHFGSRRGLVVQSPERVRPQQVLASAPSPKSPERPLDGRILSRGAVVTVRPLRDDKANLAVGIDDDGTAGQQLHQLSASRDGTRLRDLGDKIE